MDGETMPPTPTPLSPNHTFPPTTTTSTEDATHRDVTSEADFVVVGNQDFSISEAKSALRARGVLDPELGRLLDTARLSVIADACRWFDEQSGVGPGLLISVIRSGEVPTSPPASRRSSIEREREYGESIVRWLQAKFPALCAEDGRPHPAAVAAVIRLHYRYGKGRLTVREHGPEIRDAVRRFDQRQREWEAELEATAGDPLRTGAEAR